MHLLDDISNQCHADDTIWQFYPALKVAAERVVSAADTLRQLHAICARIPVTRISDLTPLDPLRLPVYSVVTPLARDLTTHMGKGQNETAAKVSALMEAVERISAETPAAPTVFSSFRDLLNGYGICPLDPRTLELPPTSGFNEKE
jgi:ribosomal protein S12 methylthiotransferase accessory factor